MSRSTIVFLLVIAMLSACNPNVAEVPPQNRPTIAPITDSPVTTITFASYDRERSYFEPLINLFNRENPDIQVIFVDLEEVGEQGSLEGLRTTVSAADTTIASISPDDITKGYVLDLKPLIDVDATFDLDDYYPGAFEPLSADSGIYVLPTTVRAPMIAYNKTMVEEAGITVPEELTWDDLHTFAAIVAEEQDGGKQHYGLMTNNTGVESFMVGLEQAGIDPFALSQDDLDLEQPAIVTVLEETQAMIKSGAIWHAVPYAQRLEEFKPIEFPITVMELAQQQRLAFWDTRSFLLPDVAESLPYEVGFVPMPDISLPYDLPDQEGYIISSGTLHPQAAWRWVSFLSEQMTPLENRADLSEIPARRSLAEQRQETLHQNSEYVDALRVALERPKARPAHFDASVLWALQSAVDTAVRSDESATEILRAAEDEIANVPWETSTPSAVEPIVVATPVILPAGSTEIRFGIADRSQELREIVDQFREAHPDIYVDIISIEQRYGPNVTPQFAQTSDLVDCFTWNAVPPTEMLTTTLDLRPLIEADTTFLEDDYPPALLGYFDREGGTHGLPLRFQLRALAYNEGRFEDASLAPPHSEMSLDDFLALAEQMTRREGGEQKYGYAMPFGDPLDMWFFLEQFDASISQAGLQGPEPDFTNPAVVEALTFYVDLLREYSPHEDLPGYAGGIMIDYIDSGAGAMWMEHGYGALSFDTQDSEAVVPRLVAPPRNADTIGPSDVIVDGMYISAQSPYPDACWKWLTFFSDHSELLYQTSFPARRSAAQSPTFLAELTPGAAELYEAYLPALNEPTALVQEGLFNDPFFDPFWLYRAVDRAVQGEDLVAELELAQTLTSEYLLCRRSGGTQDECVVE